MAYASWTPLWSGIVESSLWDEPDPVIKVFITMLAIKDSDHVCRATAYQLAKKTGKTEVEVLDALKVLSSPDTRRHEHQDFEGRRIEAVEEGWLILNGEKYREKVSQEMARARNRRSQAAWRERQKIAGKFPPKSQGLPGELEDQKMRRRGASQEELDRHQTDHLPEGFQEPTTPYQTPPPTPMPELE